MTRDELEELLKGEEIQYTLDVKTLVLDTVRNMSNEELLQIFWDKLPEYEVSHIRDYLYMKRG